MLEVEAIRSRHGPTYKIHVSGTMNRIDVSGYTQPVYVGVDDLTYKLVDDRLTLNRADGSGRSVSYAARRKVVEAVLQKLKEVEKAELQNRRKDSKLKNKLLR